MDSSGEAVLYGSDESRESTAMVELLNELGVAFEYRSVNRDPIAMREWEKGNFDKSTTSGCPRPQPWEAR